MINTLLIFKNEVWKQTAIKALEAYYRDQVQIETMSSMQDAIEGLEIRKTNYELVIFEQKNNSLTMAKILFPLCSGAKFILCSDQSLDLASLVNEYIVEQSSLQALLAEMPRVLKKFESMGYLIPIEGIQNEYIAVKPEVVASYCPLNYNVYIKMVDGRFVRLFHKGDPIERADFDRHQNEKGIALFYFNKKEYQEVLLDSAKKIEKLSNTVPLPEELVIRQAEKSHMAVKEIIKQIGFTQEAQLVAKSSVAMTAKIIGSRPQLSKILKDLKGKNGNYVSSHSVAVGTLACAIAHRLEWNSATTYFKLSLAAFMHDISISDNLAEVNEMKDGLSSQYSEDEINKIKLHPVHAADYVRKLSEIPGDVDQIVFQHHERADGKGFPRGLTGKFISPLASVFIVAHELIEYIRTHEGGTLTEFLRTNEEGYRQGNFRKIWLALSTSES